MFRTLICVLTLSCATPTEGHDVIAAPTSGPQAVVTVQEFDDSLADPWADFVQRVGRGEKFIEIRINSFGGSIIRGLDFIQALEDLKTAHGVKTVCVVDTRAYSMGYILLQSRACDMRVMTKRSTLLAHNGSSKAGGTREELEEGADFLRALNFAMAEIGGARLKIGVEGYRKKVERRAWILTWQEALEVGAVDKVLE